jgi:antitoxin PrlF
MELSTKITSKGQVTIPVAVRRKLGVKAGERVTFVFRRPGEAIFRRAASSSVSSSRGALAGKTNGKVATAADIRQAAAAGAGRGHSL